MNRTRLPADRAVGTSTTKPSRRWQTTAVALATAALLSVPSFDAQALALGRVTVQSALGEALRVDIDLPEITAEEASSLKATIAPPATFQSAGMEYNAALANVQVAVQRRSDGTYFLRLSGDRPINDPFVDVVLETSWSSGRIRRDFTMLFDPPAMRQGRQPLTAQTSPVPSSNAESTTAPAQPRVQQQRPAAAATASARAPAALTPMPAGKGDGKPVTVQAGDTAGKIASANKPATVSLDQMLVALLRSNPEAFAGGNINRLRAGTVLNLPSQEQAEAVSPSDARETLVAQSRDFNEFRRKLAEAVPAAPSAGTERETRGTVQGQVDEKKPSAATPDRLTLSKGGVQGKTGEDKIARDRSAKDSATRMAELNRNLADLNGVTAAADAPKAGPSTAAGPAGGKAATPGTGPSVALGTPSGTMAPAPIATTAAAPSTTPAKPATSPAAAAPSSTPAPAAKATTAPAPAPSQATAAAPAPTPAPAATPSAAPATAAAPAVTGPAPAPGTSSTPSTMAPASTGTSTPAAPAAARKPVAPAPAAEPSLVDQIVEEPLVPGVIGAAVLALLALVGWRARQRYRATAVDSSFLESRLQPDSFFGASGGQRVDTNEGTATGSSMVYSPSQLDAAGDVDPVAEADVYLAYGRDLQAEEILKEALRMNPQRVAIHVKLLEIYAKRRDAKAFEQVASEAYSLTHGEGGEWARICELGQELDPSNPMYKPGGQPGAAIAAGAGSFPPVADPVSLNTTRQPAAAAPVPSAVDLDLDLDFSLGDEPAPAASTAGAAPAPASRPQQPAMDFSSQTTEPAPLEAPSLSLSGDSLDFSQRPAPAASSPHAAAAQPAKDPGMMEFDLGALSLDLDSTPKAPTTMPAAAPARAAAPAAKAAPAEAAFIDMNASDNDDPLATKLALAEEFNAIGDADGARSLAQEVIAEASGDLKSKAQKFLAEIG